MSQSSPSLPQLPAQFAIYQILDELRGRSCTPPGVAGRIHRLLDDLRYAKGPELQIALLEELSLALHRERIGLDDAQAFSAEINRIADGWLETQIPEDSSAGLARRDHSWLSQGKI